MNRSQTNDHGFAMETRINDHVSVVMTKTGAVFTAVDGHAVVQCRHAVLLVPIDVQVSSMTDAIQRFVDADASVKADRTIGKETNFFVHASSVQAWVESGYDIDVIDERIAFPVLEHLVPVDEQARVVLLRIIEGRWKDDTMMQSHDLLVPIIKKILMHGGVGRDDILSFVERCWNASDDEKRSLLVMLFQKPVHYLFKHGVLKPLVRVEKVLAMSDEWFFDGYDFGLAECLSDYDHEVLKAIYPDFSSRTLSTLARHGQSWSILSDPAGYPAFLRSAASWLSIADLRKRKRGWYDKKDIDELESRGVSRVCQTSTGYHDTIINAAHNAAVIAEFSDGHVEPVPSRCFDFADDGDRLFHDQIPGKTATTASTTDRVAEQLRWLHDLPWGAVSPRNKRDYHPLVSEIYPDPVTRNAAALARNHHPSSIVSAPSGYGAFLIARGEWLPVSVLNGLIDDKKYRKLKARCRWFMPTFEEISWDETRKAAGHVIFAVVRSKTKPSRVRKELFKITSGVEIYASPVIPAVAAILDVIDHNKGIGVPPIMTCRDRSAE